jgi:hypothetical protein
MTEGKPLPIVAARAAEQNVGLVLFPSILHQSSAHRQSEQSGGRG